MPTIYTVIANGGHASLCPPYKFLQAATTRGPGSTVSDGWHGLLSIVTSEKPTALS